MALNLEPHSKPSERLLFSPEPGAGLVAQVLPEPDPEPPELVCIPSLTPKDHQVPDPFSINYPQNRKMADTPVLTVQNTNEYTPLPGF
jgi:hypothetical protein